MPLRKLLVKFDFFPVVLHLLFMFAFGMAAYFYLERNMGDPGWDIYCLINRENFCPAHRRWILLPIQLPSLLALKLGAGLKPILFLHALSPTLLFYLAFLYTEYRLKDRISALAILTSYSLEVGEIYFAWPHLEMLLIVPLLAITKSLLDSTELPKAERWGLYCLLSFLIITGHPTGILPLGFILLWHISETNRIPGFALIVFGLLAIYQWMNLDNYEQALGSNLEYRVPVLLDIALRNLERLTSIGRNNPLLWLFQFLVWAQLLARKNFSLMVLSVFFFLGYIAMELVLVPANHLEPYLVPYAGLTYLLFMKLTFRQPSRVQLARITAIFLFAFGLWQIGRAREPWVNKVDTLREFSHLARQGKTSRYLIQDEDFFTRPNTNRAGFWYAESLLVSSLNSPDSSRIFIPESHFLHEVSQIPLFFEPNVWQDYFPQGFDSIPDESMPAYADAFYAELYKGDMFKMWEEGWLNRRYFNPPKGNFSWYDNPNQVHHE